MNHEENVQLAIHRRILRVVGLLFCTANLDTNVDLDYSCVLAINLFIR